MSGEITATVKDDIISQIVRVALRTGTESAANTAALLQEYAKILHELEKKYQLANFCQLRVVFYDLTSYVNNNRWKDEYEFKLGTDPIYSAMEFFLTHALKGNLVPYVLEDQSKSPDYRALSRLYVVRILETYRSEGLIPDDFNLVPNNELHALDHEGLLSLLTELNKSYDLKATADEEGAYDSENSFLGEEENDAE